jgi:hypothetical protein
VSIEILKNLNLKGPSNYNRDLTYKININLVLVLELDNSNLEENKVRLVLVYTIVRDKKANKKK